MPPRENDGRLEGQEVDHLLARDREVICRAVGERIAAGLYQRVTRVLLAESAERRRRRGWRLVYAGMSALAVLALWTGLARRSSKPDPDAPPRTVTGTAPSDPMAMIAGASTKRETAPRGVAEGRSPRQTKIAHARPRAKPAPAVVPELAVFPAIVAPNEQERLLMQIARNHPEQLAEIARQFADDAEQVQERRRTFERWVKEGGGSQ